MRAKRAGTAVNVAWNSRILTPVSSVGDRREVLERSESQTVVTGCQLGCEQETAKSVGFAVEQTAIAVARARRTYNLGHGHDRVYQGDQCRDQRLQKAKALPGGGHRQTSGKAVT